MKACPHCKRRFLYNCQFFAHLISGTRCKYSQTYTAEELTERRVDYMKLWKGLEKRVARLEARG